MFSGSRVEYDDTTIESGGFWGNVSVAEFQKTRAIPLQIPFEMLRAVLIAAMQQLEIDLLEVEKRYRSSGLDTVADVAGNKINGDNFAVTLYKKALFARAKSDLLPEFATVSGREVHENRQYVGEQKSLLSEATFAIRTLKGKKRGGVWLL